MIVTFEQAATLDTAGVGSPEPSGNGAFSPVQRDGAPRLIRLEAQTSFDCSSLGKLPVEAVGVVEGASVAFSSEPWGDAHEPAPPVVARALEDLR